MNGGGEGDGGGNGFAEWRGAVSPAARYAESGGASLTWENLTAMLPGSGGRSTKKLVQGLYGYAVPGRVVAIMGPSGSGKSTLLDSLSGRLARNVVLTGKVLLNGKKRRLDYGLVFFAETGFPCPSRRNPSDHFLRCVNSDFDDVAATMKGSMKLRAEPDLDPLLKYSTTEIRERLVEKYRISEYAMVVRNTVHEITKIEGVMEEVIRGSQASWCKQLRTLTKRSFTNMSRDFGYYWLRIIIYIIMAFCLGTIYYDVGTSYTAIQARASCGGFVSGFMTFMSIGGFPSFIEEMKVFTLERQNGHYGVAAYVISNFLSSLPFLLTVSWASASITYWMVKFRPGFSYFAFFALNLYGGVSVIESLMMIISALVPNFLMGLILGAGVIGIMMLTSGFFRLLPELPKIFWRYPVSYIVYGSWGLKGAYKNDLLGLEFEPMMPGQPKLTGEYIITDMMGLSLSHSKWLDLAMIFVLLFSYRLTFFLVLKAKEYASPYIRVAYTRFTVKRLERRASFRKTLSMTSLSKRHNPPHPMAIQEGLNSPMPY